MSTEMDRRSRAAPHLLFDELSDLAEAMAVEGVAPELPAVAARVPDVPAAVLEGHLRLWEALRPGGDDARETTRATLALRLVRLLDALDQASPVRPFSDPAPAVERPGADAGHTERLERRLRTAAVHASTLATRLARQEALADAWRERCHRVREQVIAALEAPGATLELVRALVASLGASLDGAPGVARPTVPAPAATADGPPPGTRIDGSGVERAANALAAAGDAVTVEAVGAKLGGGDVLEIARHLERWRERVGPLEVIGFGTGALELADELMRLCAAGGERALAAERAAASEARAALDRERAMTAVAIERVRTLESRLHSVEQSARVARNQASRAAGVSRDEAVSSLTAQNAALRLQLAVLQAERSRLQAAPAQGSREGGRSPADGGGGASSARSGGVVQSDG